MGDKKRVTDKIIIKYNPMDSLLDISNKNQPVRPASAIIIK
jgi:hypothetical protein